MSYHFRDKPARFSDRLRSGNSGDDLMESLKRQFDQDSKTFFEPTAARTSREREIPFDHRHIGFSRGFPFDDDGFERRGNIRSHLDDLAARHPELADQLLGPPWGDAPFLSTPRNRRRGSGLGSYQGHPDDDTRSQASGSSAASAASGASGVSSHGEPESYSRNQEPQINQQEPRKNQIPQYGLRNTVDIGQHRHNMDNNNEKMNRGQRSASAPPENRQSQQQEQQYSEPQQQQQQQQPQNQNQRFVSRVDITPQQQPAEVHKPPISPKQNHPQQSPPYPQPSQQQKPQQQGNVRHIPIFVEGRDEPVVPKNVEEQSFPQQQQRPQSPPQFHRPSHFNQHFANARQQQQQQWPPHYQQQSHQQPHYEQHTTTQQAQKPDHYEQQQQHYRQQQAEKQRVQQQQQQQQQQEAEPAPKLKQIQPKEPLERVALVQQEVDSLMEQIKLYNGNSRQAKDYMYLDEMLTRELIKLDDIETEGKPNVRQARKNAIKSIQECIALLESKVPLPGQQEEEKSVKEEEKPLPSMETEATTAESEQPEVPQSSPIPLPPAPVSEQGLTSEELTLGQEKTLSDEPMPVENCHPLTKAPSATAMETQQDLETNKIDAEASQPTLDNVEGSSEQQMDVDSSSRTTKAPRKERKTKVPKPVSEEPIPLPAPEVCHT